MTRPFYKHFLIYELFIRNEKPRDHMVGVLIVQYTSGEMTRWKKNCTIIKPTCKNSISPSLSSFPFFLLCFHLSLSEKQEKLKCWMKFVQSTYWMHNFAKYGSSVQGKNASLCCPKEKQKLGGLKMHLYNCRHACLLSQDYVPGQMQQCRISLLIVASRCEPLSLAWSRSLYV